MSKNQKRNLTIGIGALAVIGAGLGTYFVMQNPTEDKTPTLDDQIQQSVVSKLFGFTDNGIVKLFDTKDGTELDSFDLKTLATGKEAVVEEEPVVQDTRKPVVINEFEGFIRVPHIVVSGESSWNIQKALTPNRDTAKILKLVAKANGKNQKLHPIYPGETIFYLQEKDGSSPQEVVKEVQTGEALPEKQKAVKKVDDKSVYLYSKSEDFKTLYAYNAIEKTFYSVEETDKKIEVKTILTDDALEGVTDFKVVKNHLYLVFAEGTKVKEIRLSDSKQLKTYNLQGTTSLFAVRDGFFYYTYADQLGRINLKDGEETNILLGDKSTDYIFSKDNLFILNEFGSKMDNSVLIKVNPAEMKVDDLVELKSKDNAILSEEVDTETIFVGQIHKTTDLNKKVIEEDVVLPVNAHNLSKELFVKEVSFNKEAIEVDSFIYELIEGTAIIYSATNGKVSTEINVDDSTKLMPLK